MLLELHAPPFGPIGYAAHDCHDISDFDDATTGAHMQPQPRILWKPFRADLSHIVRHGQARLKVLLRRPHGCIEVGEAAGAGIVFHGSEDEAWVASASRMRNNSIGASRPRSRTSP